MRRKSLIAGIMPLVSFALIGCGGRADKDVVARVGAEEITLEELRLFKEDMSALFRSQKEGLEEARDYLQTMIDMELMLIEAREQGLDQEVEFRQKWEKERQKKLVAEFLQRNVRKKIAFPPEELQRRFDESKWNRLLKLARIRVKTEAEARKVVGELERGRRFEEVARELSTDQATASEGGLLEPFYGRLNIRPLGLTSEIVEELFELKVGEFSRPFQLRDRYEIFNVAGEGPAPPGYRETFAREILRIEFFNRQRELVAELAAEFGTQLDEQGIAHLIEKAPDFSGEALQFSDQEQQMTLCRFDGGQFTLKDFTDTYQQVWLFRPVQFDSSGIADFVYRYLLPETLIYRVALREGLEQDESIIAWLEAKKKTILLERMRHKEVEQQIEISDEAVREYYETHQDRFISPAYVQVLEILVERQEEAEALLQRIRSGEDMEELASRHTIRHGAREVRGRFRMHPFERGVYGVLLDEVMDAEVGELRGPLAVEEGFSVFKVVEKGAPKQQPFEQAALRAMYWIKQQEEARLFQALIDRLRKKYAAEVVLFEDRLKAIDRRDG